MSWHNVFLEEDVFEGLCKLGGRKSVYDYMKYVLESHVSAQQGVHWMAYAVLGLGVFVLGAIFGFWLAGI